MKKKMCTWDYSYQRIYLYCIGDGCANKELKLSKYRDVGLGVLHIVNTIMILYFDENQFYMRPTFVKADTKWTHTL